MTDLPRIPAKPALVLATAALAACTAAAGAADPGGAAYAPPAPSHVGTAAFHARATALLGRRLALAGLARPGTRVRIQARAPRSHRWRAAATAQAGADGTYSARWRADRAGVVALRAVPVGRASARSASAQPTLRVTVFEAARATWYGPGLYGHRTACGQRLTRSLVGVAHRTLPCGTKVAIVHDGRRLTVPVVDRGPFAHNADWDLTAAAAERLGFTGTGTVGVLPHRARRR